MDTGSAAEEILAGERRALDRWSAGDPLGYVTEAADDVTYFDDIGAQERIEGRDALREYASGLEGKIPPHEYEMANPNVQLIDDVAILTYTYVASLREGGASTPWKATTVYHRADGDWRLVHAHWSLVKAI